VIFRTMLHGGYFEYWKAGLVVVDSNSYLESKGSIEDIVSFREMITSQLLYLRGNLNNLSLNVLRSYSISTRPSEVEGVNQAYAQKQCDKDDASRQEGIFGVITLFEQAKEAKEDMRKQYAKSKDISLERCTLLQIILDDGAWKDYQSFLDDIYKKPNEMLEEMICSSFHLALQPTGGYHVVSPPITGTFIPPKPDLVFHTAPIVVETDHSAFIVQLSPSKPAQDLSHTNRPSAPIIKDWVSDSEDKSETTAQQNVPSFVQTSKKVKTPRHSVVQQSGIKCFNCKEFGHFAKECKKPKRAKDYTYHKENMLLCKQAEKEPLEHLPFHDDCNVFSNERQHSEQPESINDTCVVKKVDSNAIPNLSDICHNEGMADQNADICDDEHVVLANLIANLKLDTVENKRFKSN
nr:hypothetical protein [Tanacetum cinerariifolium]